MGWFGLMWVFPLTLMSNHLAVRLMAGPQVLHLDLLGKACSVRDPLTNLLSVILGHFGLNFTLDRILRLIKM